MSVSYSWLSDDDDDDVIVCRWWVYHVILAHVSTTEPRWVQQHVQCKYSTSLVCLNSMLTTICRCL